MDAAQILTGIGTIIGTAYAAYSVKRAAKSAANSTAATATEGLDQIRAELSGQITELARAFEHFAERTTAQLVKHDIRVERLEKHETGEWTPPAAHWHTDRTRPGLGPRASQPDLDE